MEELTVSRSCLRIQCASRVVRGARSVRVKIHKTVFSCKNLSSSGIVIQSCRTR
uniref:Uncharacterized protein n=1 Tax=Physcomitrium patens TaxID=3218 RepID=A0A2K1KL46_PHYPA|nr:hypothetical protein PHYPA_008172 [Physcomitrium patens]